MIKTIFGQINTFDYNINEEDNIINLITKDYQDYYIKIKFIKISIFDNPILFQNILGYFITIDDKIFIINKDGYYSIEDFDKGIDIKEILLNEICQKNLLIDYIYDISDEPFLEEITINENLNQQDDIRTLTQYKYNYNESIMPILRALIHTDLDIEINQLEVNTDKNVRIKIIDKDNNEIMFVVGFTETLLLKDVIIKDCIFYGYLKDDNIIEDSIVANVTCYSKLRG